MYPFTSRVQERVAIVVLVVVGFVLIQYAIPTIVCWCVAGYLLVGGNDD